MGGTCQGTLFATLKGGETRARKTCSFYRAELLRLQKTFLVIEFLVFRRYVILLSGRSYKCTTAIGMTLTMRV